MKTAMTGTATTATTRTFKRAILLAALLFGAAMFFTTSQAEAHRWRGGFGWRGSVGYRGWGYRNYGWGYRPYGYRSYSYGSFYRPFYGSFYPRTYVGFSVPFYRSYYYPSYYRSYYSPSYYYGGFGCASSTPVITTPNVVVSPVAPVYADASQAYGPDAVKEFLGLDRDIGKGSLAPQPLVVDVKPVDDGRRIVAAPEKDADERFASNVEARKRAARFVSFGDGKFGEQEYHSAAQRYRFAIEAAPDVAPAHFRQGFAYVASNRYDLAVKAFRRGLALDPLWVNSSFRVDDIYGRNRLAKSSHIDTLAKNALIDRGNPDFFFLVGVLLHFDGQQERAKKFFQRAEKLAGEDTAHIDAFLNPPLPRAEDAV